MEAQKVSVQRVGTVAGLLTSTTLVAYFLLMKYLNLIQIAELRALNIFILYAGIWFTFRYLWSGNRSISYLEGFGVACKLLGICVGLFALFIYFYLSLIDPALVDQLKEHSPLAGDYLTPLTAAIAIVFEGIGSGIVLVFSFMQLFQNRFFP